MYRTFTTHPDDAAIDWSRVDWSIAMVANPRPDLAARYRVTCSDQNTGTFIGEAAAPAAPGGGLPSITVADVVELIGSYRLASIVIEIEAEQLHAINRRCADRQRRRAHGWLRSVPNSVLAAHEIDALVNWGVWS